jgi:hypothetical protein
VVDGGVYWAPASSVTLVTFGSQFFYRVPKNAIREGQPPSGALMTTTPLINVKNNSTTKKKIEKTPSLSALQVFGDEDEDKECCICFNDQKSVVFVPCGNQ